jgi:hypothetical protein
MTLRWVQAARSSGLRESGKIGMPTAAPLAVAPNPNLFTPTTRPLGVDPAHIITLLDELISRGQN